ncbi:Gfo/Idh/MocA family protein, partial [Micromonospora zhanjiangensis]
MNGPARVALIGANGHGLHHRRNLTRLAAQGVVEPVALCDVRPVEEPGDVPVFTDHRALLAETRPDVVIVCTPPHTHLEIALDAVAAGADLLLEKPPVSSLVEHDVLLAALDEHGRAGQVGFQALGSAALPDLVAAARHAAPASVGVAAFGSWWRPDSYWR